MTNATSFFADENISFALINWLRKEGYNASGVKEEKMEGTSDVDIIHKCFASQNIILKHDNDFGKIIFTHSVTFQLFI